MKMSSCLGASILLVLSLEAALLVAGVDLHTIRLPSDTQVAAAAARPWECCNVAACSQSTPPICNCFDEVEQCAPTCKSCEVSMADPSRYVCNDEYTGDPGPKCPDENRPWKCCDAAGCTKSIPPICHCGDEVDQCAPNCKNCEASSTNPSLFVCKDRYVGDPGPICRPWKCCDEASCTKSIPPICRCGDEMDECDPNCKSCVPSTTNPSRFVCKDIYRGDLAPICRPWDCCDAATCTKSIPPICHCQDEVDQCAATCEQCAASTVDPSRNVCNDQYRGEPGPRCTDEGVGTAGGN